MSQNAPTTARTAVHKGPNPLVLIIVGGLLLAAWLGVSLFQIQTTEAWTLGGNPPGLGVNWGVLTQFGSLVAGNLSGAAGKAVVVGWTVEIITIVFGVSLEIAAHGVAKSSELLRSIFVFGGFALLAFNGWTDYAYGSLPSGTSGQIFFASLMSFVVVFGLPASLELLFRAKADMAR